MWGSSIPRPGMEIMHLDSQTEYHDDGGMND